MGYVESRSYNCMLPRQGVGEMFVPTPQQVPVWCWWGWALGAVSQPVRLSSQILARLCPAANRVPYWQGSTCLPRWTMDLPGPARKKKLRNVGQTGCQKPVRKAHIRARLARQDCYLAQPAPLPTAGAFSALSSHSDGWYRLFPTRGRTAGW